VRCVGSFAVCHGQEFDDMNVDVREDTVVELAARAEVESTSDLGGLQRTIKSVPTSARAASSTSKSI
jgi:hypothetical protein